MSYLFDTQILIWAAREPERLDRETVLRLKDMSAKRIFSVASVWESAIKLGLDRSGFRFDLTALRSGLLARGFLELSITSEHALAVQYLPLLHRDPFDRMLVAQATVEGLVLITADKTIAQYPGPIQLVS